MPGQQSGQTGNAANPTTPKDETSPLLGAAGPAGDNPSYNSMTTAQQQSGSSLQQEEGNNPAQPGSTGEENLQSTSTSTRPVTDTNATVNTSTSTLGPVTPKGGLEPAFQSSGGRFESGGSRFSSEDFLGEESPSLGPGQHNYNTSSGTATNQYPIRTAEDEQVAGPSHSRGINIPRLSYDNERPRPLELQRQSLAQPSTVVEGSLRDNILNSSYTQTKDRLLAQDKIEEELETINEESDSSSNIDDSDSE